MSGNIKAALGDPKKRLRIIFILGIVGIVLIMLSEILPKSRGEMAEVSGAAGITLDETEAYRESLEKQLADMISDIRGVGQVRVMVTIAGTKEYIYAEQSELSRQTDSGKETFRQNGEIILTEDGGDRSPVVRKIASPEIGGAAVICEGADDPQTKERVMNAVSAVLGLPSSKISVEQMK